MHVPNQSTPSFFQELIRQGCLTDSQIRCTDDGFFAVTKSLADILIDRGISSLPGSRGRALECRYFFDDWYLFALSGSGVYGLFKMREQENDAQLGVTADGDSPGVTVSFLAFDTNTLAACLSDPSPANRAALEQEINRVVASRGQRHSGAMKAYFQRAQSRGAYLIAQLYVEKIASFSENRQIPVPTSFKRPRRSRRLSAFLEANNRAAGHVVCDRNTIFLENPSSLSMHEQLAILATHTANVSYQSFAAEVCFHAKFLTKLARIPIPFLGRSVYDSAIRADMTIDEAELVGPTPYYRVGSRLLRQQRKYHPDI